MLNETRFSHLWRGLSLEARTWSRIPNGTRYETSVSADNGLFSATPDKRHESQAKTTLLSILKNITKGELTIESLGEEYKLGAPFDFCVDGHSFPISAKVTVKDESLWVRMLLHADYGFAGATRHQSCKSFFSLLFFLVDALMLGEVDCDKMTDVFKVNSNFQQSKSLNEKHGLTDFNQTKIFVLNRKAIGEGGTFLTPLFSAVSYV